MTYKESLDKKLQELAKKEAELTKLRKDIENWDGFLPIHLPFNLQTLQLEFTSLWSEVSKMISNIREGKIKPNEM